MNEAKAARPAMARKTTAHQALTGQVYLLGRAKATLLWALAGFLPVALLAAGLLMRLPGIPLALLALVPTPALEVALALNHRRLWPAQETLSWLNWSMPQDRQKQVGGKYPLNPRQAEAWLAAHPEGSVPDGSRVGALLAAGKVAEAREAIARLQVETAGQRHRRADLELAAEVTDGLPLDTAAADEAVRSDPDEPPALVAAHLAYHAALKVVAAGGDGTAPLAAVRPSLGRLPSEVIRRLWFSRLYYAVVSALIGAWLLACVVVGLGTAGGVVWF